MLEGARERIESERWRYGRGSLGSVKEKVEAECEDEIEEGSVGECDEEHEDQEDGAYEDKTNGWSDESSQSSHRTVTEDEIKEKKLKGWDVKSERGKVHEMTGLNDEEWPSLSK